MNTVRQRWIVTAFGLLLLGTLYGCLVAGRGYDRDVGGVYVGGYYEPYGHDYGGWGHNYQVAPPRGNEHRAQPSTTHAYRPAPPTRSVPSLPKRQRPQDKPDKH